MPDFSPSDDLRRQLNAHVQSLRDAGIEWLPLGAPLTMAVLSERVIVDATPKPQAPSMPKLSASPPENTASSTNCTLEQRRQALAVLADEVKKCTQCAALASTRTQTVFGQGQAGAEICFVGEAPGADEDAQGLPFVGAAGQLLNKILDACGLKREDVYICNILKCRPPGNRTPLPDEASCCRGFLERQIDLVKPNYIVALGGCAATNLLQTTQSLGKLRGRFHDFRGIPVMVTYHPAYLLPHRAPEKKRDVWEDMKWLMGKMGREIPKRE